MKKDSMHSAMVLPVLLACILAGLAGAHGENTFETEEIMRFLKLHTKTGYAVMNTAERLKGEPGHRDYDRMRLFSHPSPFETAMAAKGSELPRELYLAARVVVPVHETCHHLTDMLCQHKAPGTDVIPPCDGNCADRRCMCIWPAGGAPVLVSFTAIFPSSRIAEDYPPELLKAESVAQHRFPTYIAPSVATRSTQQNGIYGLLNEYNAYLVGARAAFEVEPWYRKNSGANPAIYQVYFTTLGANMFAYPQFRMYILHYLSYAKENERDIYRGIMGNAPFRRAFRSVDSAWKKLANDYSRREREIIPILAARGLTLHGTSGLPKVLSNVIYGSMRDRYFALAAEEMEKEKYLAVLAELQKE